MEKKPRVDKKKNVWKVAEVLAKHPHATESEIAKMANVSSWTAHNAKKELEKNWGKDLIIQYIVNASKVRIKRAQRIFDRYLDELENKKTLERWDVSLTRDIIKDDLQRVTVLGGDVTNDQGWLKEIKILLPK